MMAVHLAEHGPEPLPPNNIHHAIKMAKEAVELAKEGHDVIHAAHNKKIGWIDFIQGAPGTPEKGFEDGGGITHIKEKRDYQHAEDANQPDGDTVLKNLPDVLCRGEVSKEGNFKRKIRYEGWEAIVIHVDPKDTDQGTRERWLLSAFSRIPRPQKKETRS